MFVIRCPCVYQSFCKDGNNILAKKVAIEASRRSFFNHHRSIFEPLLPAHSTFFDKLCRESVKPQDGVYRPRRDEEQPSLIQAGNMKDYQLDGLSFLVWMHKNGMNCILGDEMGLGKTLQTLSLLAYMKETENCSLFSFQLLSLILLFFIVIPEPHLVICPLSVLSSWMTVGPLFLFDI